MINLFLQYTICLSDLIRRSYLIDFLRVSDLNAKVSALIQSLNGSSLEFWIGENADAHLISWLFLYGSVKSSVRYKSFRLFMSNYYRLKTILLSQDLAATSSYLSRYLPLSVFSTSILSPYFISILRCHYRCNVYLYQISNNLRSQYGFYKICAIYAGLYILFQFLSFLLSPTAFKSDLLVCVLFCTVSEDIVLSFSDPEQVISKFSRILWVSGVSGNNPRHRASKLPILRYLA